MSVLLDYALWLALQTHLGQTTKDRRSFILHPITVMTKMQTEEEQIVALLHDVLEEDKDRIDQIEKQFSKEVFDAVIAITRNEGESYKDYIARIKLNPLATKVKIKDLEHNMDTLRLPDLTDEDLRRLKKYHKSYRFLAS